MNPADPLSIAQHFNIPVPVLIGYLRCASYSVWVWEGQDGEGYVSKQPAKGKAFAWKPETHPLSKVQFGVAKVWRDQNRITPV